MLSINYGVAEHWVNHKINFFKVNYHYYYRDIIINERYPK